MKRTLLLFIVNLLSLTLLGQQIPLKGVVTVQNSLTNTGKIEYVSEASISHPNAKPTATDSQGAFTLFIFHLKRGVQTAIKVKPTGRYKDYIVVDERAISDITLGRLETIRISIQDKSVLKEEEEKFIANTMKKLDKIRERKIAELNKRIATLEAANDYANEIYQKSIDSLTFLANDKAETLKRIREYAQYMVLINLDEADSIYRKAYHFFTEGELDSVASYLKQHINFEEENKQIQLQQNEAQNKKNIARELDEQADLQLANAEGAKAQLLKKLLLAAKASEELYNHTESIQYYEKALVLVPEDIQTIWVYADYLYRIKESTKALNHFLKIKELIEKVPRINSESLGRVLNALGEVSLVLQDYKSAEEYLARALEVIEQLVAENPRDYLPDLAKNLNNQGNNSRAQREYTKAAELFGRAVTIYEQLSKENPKVYLPYLAMSLNGQGVNYNEQREYTKADECYDRVITIVEQLSKENPKVYLPNLAISLNSQGINYKEQREYTKAAERYSRAVTIDDQLAKENPKVYLPNLAQSLNNQGANYNEQKEYTKAAECYSRAVTIYEQLSKENPKLYLPDLAMSLNNQGTNYNYQKEYTKAAELFGRAVTIYEQLSKENPKLYLPNLAECSYAQGCNYYVQGEYTKAAEFNGRSVTIYEQLSKENPKAYRPKLATSLIRQGDNYTSQTDFTKGTEFYARATTIYEQLSKENPKLYLPDLAMSLNNQGTNYNYQKEYTKAAELFGRAVTIYEQLSKENPKVYLPYLAMSLNAQGINYNEQREYTKAAELLGRSVTIYEQLAKESPKVYLSVLVMILTNQGVLYKALKDYTEAQAQLQKALQLSEQLARESNENISRLIIAYNDLADISLYTHDYNKANLSMKEAIRLNKTLQYPVQGLEKNLALSLLLQGQYAEAWELYKIFARTFPATKGNPSGLKCLEDLERLIQEELIPSKHQVEVRKVIDYLKSN